MTLYAVGDIHGQIGMLHTALELIERDGGADAQVVFLGDLVDRGPDSNGVIQLLIDAVAAGRNWTVLKGNHDRMFEWFMSDPPRMETRLPVGLDWLHDRVGGAATLASYGVKVSSERRMWQVLEDAHNAVPQAHLDFIAGLPLTVIHGRKLFVHAGILPGVQLSDQSKDDLVWIREPFLSDKRDHGYLVVHGHSPVDLPEHHGNRIALDTGAGYGRALTAVVFENDVVYMLTDTGRIPIVQV